MFTFHRSFYQVSSFPFNNIFNIQFGAKVSFIHDRIRKVQNEEAQSLGVGGVCQSDSVVKQSDTVAQSDPQRAALSSDGLDLFQSSRLPSEQQLEIKQ